MTELSQPIGRLLAEVRARRHRLLVCRGVVRAALVAAGALAVGLALAAWAGQSPRVVASLAGLALAGAAGGAVWGLRGLWTRPSDAATARFIEEHHPELDERLVSVVGLTTIADPAARPAFAEAMTRDAERATSAIEPSTIITSEQLRRAGIQAAAAVLALAAVVLIGRETARRSVDAVALSLFPSRIRIEVTPGHARVQAGSALNIEARLVGNDAPVVAQLLRAEEDGEEWRAADMTANGDGRFAVALPGLARPFRYQVVAAGVRSEVFDVTVVRPPRVERIDLDYTYPKAFGLEPRVEKDGGDIFAPAGTTVRVSVHTDAPIATGRMVFGRNDPLTLTPDGSGRTLTGTLTIAEDNSYRVALADREGMTSPGDTEYFIRMLDDRPPDVHVVRPASDRRVTALEEVDVEAEASDDFGVASLELVYAVRGGKEQVVPLRIPSRETTVSGSHTLFLEDLDVRPGDFVSYYVRARDVARGKRSSETRSDIFFLEIKPFEEEFTLAQSQAAMGGGASNPEIDDLVNAQKEIIVATWKLDRRTQTASGARSAQDVRAVGAAEDELKTRVERAASAFGTSRMRRPNRPPTGRGPAPPPVPAPSGRAGQTLAEEDAMTAAAAAMGAAVEQLNALKTADAIGPEMEALNQLLRAQADVKRREVQRQQAGGGGGGNRRTQDLSSLFDKELARQQETNYEAPNSASGRGDEKEQSAIDKIKDLASRQDELMKRQQELARNQSQLTEEERRRQLERLTRDQNELRQRAEELAEQMARQNQNGQSSSSDRNQSGNQSAQQPQPGQQPGQQQGQQSQAGQSGQAGQAGERRPSPNGQASGQGDQGTRQLRRISEEMRNATGDLRRQDAGQASERAARALDDLRALEQQMQGSSPDGQRRALGDSQLEARQLAEAERRIAGEAARAGQAGDADTMRRLAGEQERLGDRLGRVQEQLKQQAQSGGRGAQGGGETQQMQQAAGEASREIDRQRLRERMSQSADAMRASAGESGSPRGNQAPGSEASQQDIARALDRLADRLAAAGAGRGRDSEGQRLAENMARVQELRERLDEVTERLDRLNREAAGQSAGQDGRSGTPQNGQRGPSSSSQQPGTQAGQTGRASSPSEPSPGQSGQPGQGNSGASGTGGELTRLQEEAQREMQEVRRLLDDMRRDDSAFGQGGLGRTFEGQGMTLSAPGTEGFKQDFARWQELNRQMTAALDRVESSLAQKLQQKAARDRLAAGADDAPPAEYQQQVDSYFRALAARKKP